MHESPSSPAPNFKDFMRLLGLDFETTGLDTGKDRIVEVGAVLWEAEAKKPILVYNSLAYDASYPEMSAEVTAVNGITQGMLAEFGKPPRDVIQAVEEICSAHQVDYLVAHNAENFDKPMLYAELQKYPFWQTKLCALPWIDTRTDIPHRVAPSSQRLVHLAAECGFVNPFAHRAVFDVITMLRVLSNYDIKDVLEYQAIPFITVQATVSYDNRQLAKDARFSWEKIGTQTYPKLWVKRIKQNMLETEKKNCKFPIKEIK